MCCGYVQVINISVQYVKDSNKIFKENYAALCRAHPYMDGKMNECSVYGIFIEHENVTDNSSILNHWTIPEFLMF